MEDPPAVENHIEELGDPQPLDTSGVDDEQVADTENAENASADAAAEETDSVNPVPEEPAVPQLSSTEQCVEWILQRVKLPKLNATEMWTDIQRIVVTDFVQATHPARMLVWVQPNVGLQVVMDEIPSEITKQEVMYFVRHEASNGSELQPSTVNKMVQYGTIHGITMDTLLRLMNGLYVPGIQEAKSWPQSVKKEFIGYLHKFMLVLTENAHQAKGNTVLYIPNEQLTNLRAAVEDQDLAQQLESAVIHWTRQIKEVVSSQVHMKNNIIMILM